MRVSTAGMHRTTIDAILDHQVKLSKTQNQVTTGKKFQTAAEDPIGAARVAGLDRTHTAAPCAARATSVASIRA